MTSRPWLDSLQPPGANGAATPTASPQCELRSAPGGATPPPMIIEGGPGVSVPLEEFLGGGDERGGSERRVSLRRPHRVFQWIAPCIDGQLPDQTMFYPVKCIDISRTGIAFFTEEALTTEQVIIALGTTEEAFYVRSRVANCAPVQNEDGWRFRVGCEFVERYGRKEGVLKAPE
jgi:PilZ domain